MTLLLTVIDQTPIHANSTLATAPAMSVDLAIECEKMGYHRYWLAEHHNSIQFAGTTPEKLVSRIASATQRIRVGSGGVMLTHYSPFKVAETFALLGGLFPGRMDLGVGRAPGENHISSVALASLGDLIQHDHFPQQAGELCEFIRGSFPSGHPYTALTLPTDVTSQPSLWMLGSGGGSSALAGRLGMGLALAKTFVDTATSHCETVGNQKSEIPKDPHANMRWFITAQDRDPHVRKRNPPTRRTYLTMIISTPFILLLALWMQDDLTPYTTTLALGVTGLLYLNIRWIQDFFRADWRQEYEQKLAHTEAQLAREDLTAKQRRQLQCYRNQLPDRFHLVTSPDQTYRTVKVVGVALKAAAHAAKDFFR